MVLRSKKSLDDDTTLSTSTGGSTPRLRQSHDDDHHGDIVFRTYPQAWIALIILIVLRTATSVFQFTFSTVPSLTGEVFGVNLTAITWLANIQGLVYVIMSVFTGWIYEQIGVKRSLLMAGFLCSIGAGARIIAIKTSPPSFALTMVAQVIGSTSSPLALNIMSMFAVTWFTENLRATAGMLSLNVGMSIAFGTIFTQIIGPYGYTDIQAGQLNAIAFFAGTIGCLREDSYGMILYLMILNQFSISFLVPVTMEMGCETHALFSGIEASYPVSEATSSSVLWQGSQVFGFIIMAFMDLLRDDDGHPKNNMQRALLLLMILAGVMVVVALAFKGSMKRTEAAALEEDTQSAYHSEDKKLDHIIGAQGPLRLSIHSHLRPSSIAEMNLPQHVPEARNELPPLVHPRVQGIKLSDRHMT
ncbi:hypothetical protein DM01DRAFT_1395062 [Hesseltinella vesiculosa]|uniref:MFS general substrate transporter n=1 Tax=Hesseltinella vesiculosa TaxID=101127 RepID=A0A1X2GTJ5_9FUNG|nr:hypothetical protein DM01DRAFT_1395062 [Hesseltinella vesiculosa]